jgi:glycosyltransferase involved in cell wall biosynthesis
MRLLLVSTQDYIHHPVPSRHHYIFEILSSRHEIHVPHFHVSRNVARATRLIVHEATIVPFTNPMIHYFANAPYHYHLFGRMLKERRFDAIVASNVLAGSAVIEAAKRHAVPVLFDLKDWFPTSAAAYFANNYTRRMLEETVGYVTLHNLRKSRLITTVSEGLKRKLASYGLQARVIANGVDTDVFKPMGTRQMRLTKKELGFDENDFLVGFAGSVERWYSLDEVIHALADLMKRRENVRLLIVGCSLFTGYREELRELANRLHLSGKVRFVDVVPYEVLPKYINAMDVCLIPLAPVQWRRIALPDKFFEYSACGKPIVSTPIGDIMNMKAPNVFIYNSPKSLAERITKLMEDPPRFKIQVDGFSWRKRAEEFEALLRDIAH